jgi:hypothetical protein
MSLWNAAYRRIRLEDGEPVVLLRGPRKTRWKSDRPHAGFWSRDRAYVLSPCNPGAVARRTAACLTFDHTLEARSSNNAVLILGSVPQIIKLITLGPAFCRVRLRRSPSNPFKSPDNTPSLGSSNALRENR